MSDYRTDLAGHLATSIRDGIRRQLLDVHTCIPGIVEAYDSEKQTADVAVAVNRFKADGTRVPGPKLPNVPVGFPSGGNWHVHAPLASGDEVLVLFAERDIDGWRQSGEQSDPLSARKFSLTDALAIPMTHSSGKASTFDGGDEDNLTIYFEGLKVVLTTGGEIRVGKQGSSQTEPVVLGNVLVAMWNQFISVITNAATTPTLDASSAAVNPPNPAFVTAMNNLKTTYLDNASTNIVSQVTFTERGT